MNRINIDIETHWKYDMESQRTIDLGSTKKGKLIAVVNTDEQGNILWLCIEEIDLTEVGK